MSMIAVDLGDSGTHEYASGITVGEVILNVHGKRSGAVAALVDGSERDFSHILDSNCSLEPINGESEAGLYILRHSCAHLLAQAVVEMFPDAKPTIGPPIDHGFYYDFHMDPIGDEELKAIEKKMNQHIRANHAMIREEYDNQTLRDMFSENNFKLENMDAKNGHDVG